LPPLAQSSDSSPSILPLFSFQSPRRTVNLGVNPCPLFYHNSDQAVLIERPFRLILHLTRRHALRHSVSLMSSSALPLTWQDLKIESFIFYDSFLVFLLQKNPPLTALKIFLAARIYHEIFLPLSLCRSSFFYRVFVCFVIQPFERPNQQRFTLPLPRFNDPPPPNNLASAIFQSRRPYLLPFPTLLPGLRLHFRVHPLCSGRLRGKSRLSVLFFTHFLRVYSGDSFSHQSPTFFLNCPFCYYPALALRAHNPFCNPPGMLPDCRHFPQRPQLSSQ